MSNELIPVEVIQNKIYIIRNQRVMLDYDIAELYGVETRALNQTVKRNIERFPEDFVFQLTNEELKVLISQIVISNKTRGGRQKLPFAFTEHGLVMVSNYIKNKNAIAISIQVIRVFNRLKELALTNKDVNKRLDEFEKAFIRYAQDNNIQIEEIFKQLDYLTDITKPNKIGFKTD